MDQTFQQEIARFIGQRLRHARAARRVSLADLARQASIPQQRLERYEGGSGRITGAELERLAVALRLPVKHFLQACVLCGNTCPTSPSSN